MLRKQRLVALCKLEAAYGVDAAPDPATDALQLREEDLKLVPLEIDSVERSIVRHFFGAFQQLVAAKWARVTVSIEGAGFGSAGPATPTPGYDALLRCGAMQRAITPGTKVDYTPISDALPSATFKWYQDGTLHTLLGAVAENVRFGWSVNQRPFIAFDLIGVHVAPSDVALPGPNLAGYQKPVVVNGANTSVFTLHGYAAPMQSLEVTIANRVAKRNLVNSAQKVVVVNRAVTGKVNFESVKLSEKDYWTPIAAGTLGALALTHGPAANRQVFTGSNVQIANPQFEDVDEIKHTVCDLIFTPSVAGNDELTYSVQ